jgi:hypothetical protein
VICKFNNVGILTKDLLIQVAKVVNNREAQRKASEIILTKSQAKIAITSNYKKLTPVFEMLNVKFDEEQREKIANSDESAVAELI